MRTVAALVLATVICAAGTGAATHPDFTGSWIVESVTTAGGEHREQPEGRHGGLGAGGFGRTGRSGDGRGREGGARGPVPDEPRLERGQRVEMTQTDRMLTVIIAPEAGGRVVRYPLDGSDGYTAALDGTALKTKTSWQGLALVTDTRVADKGGYHARQVRTMDEQGHVTIETTLDTPSGKRSASATLTKRES